MHDPMTVAFEITMPFTGKKNSKGGWDKYPRTLFTIWHVDPETDGTDDSCGWFIRSRHGKKKVLEAIEKEFALYWKELFTDFGVPKFSPMAITLHLFQCACYEVWHDWKKVDRYMKKHLYDLIRFSENPTDSMFNAITRKGTDTQEEHIRYFAAIIYPYILRDVRPSWKHPRWHIHHWKIQNHFIQTLKRFLWGRCAGCGGRFTWGYSPTSNAWDSDGPQWFRSEKGIYHHQCYRLPSCKGEL